ncbi:MAG: RdgB/HAM1 family non-canonical purine NTP pyrophosphatase [Acidobacteriota bacterium]|nr:MAG: RdgB/HAM1 family non-canonical purine NTP pyrophosphatase [Acidobacteriota bacterium]
MTRDRRTRKTDDRRGRKPKQKDHRRDARRPAATRPKTPKRAGLPIVVATKNPAKAHELAKLLEETPFTVVGAELIADLQAPVEDGATFRANAVKKALHYSRLVDSLVLADDSGLEIDALDGQPGVRSARLGGPSATDADRVRLILSKMESVPWERRTARFRCEIAIAQRGEVLASFDGSVEGRIAFEPEGSAGFGYDPIFFYEPMRMTFAAMTAEEKHHVSHRGKALERAVDWLKHWCARKSEPGSGSSG